MLPPHSANEVPHRGRSRCGEGGKACPIIYTKTCTSAIRSKCFIEVQPSFFRGAHFFFAREVFFLNCFFVGREDYFGRKPNSETKPL